MNPTIESTLKRFKLLEDDGRISLTNLSVYVVLALFSFSVIKSGAVDLPGLGALLTAIGAYRLKAHQVEKTETRVSESESLKQQVTALTAERDAMRKALDAAELKFKPKVSTALPPGLR